MFPRLRPNYFETDTKTFFETKFFETDTESFNICAKNESVRAWWKKFDPTLPILSGFARSVLAIPASLAKSERAFSKGGNIVTRKRTRLNPKKVVEIVVIQENTEKVLAFLQKTTYEVKKTETNIFAGIDIKEIVMLFIVGHM